MPFTVTQRKRGGFEYTSVAETQSAAFVLAQMMRRAGDEYCAEASVTVANAAGVVIAAWRGGGYGWQSVPVPKSHVDEGELQPQVSRPLQKRPSARFARVPTEPMHSSVAESLSRGSFASISVTDYSAVSVA
jgi:hypothetical protein